MGIFQSNWFTNPIHIIAVLVQLRYGALGKRSHLDEQRAGNCPKKCALNYGLEVATSDCRASTPRFPPPSK